MLTATEFCVDCGGDVDLFRLDDEGIKPKVLKKKIEESEGVRQPKCEERKCAALENQLPACNLAFQSHRSVKQGGKVE